MSKLNLSSNLRVSPSGARGLKIVIINYGAGNIQSIQFALQRLGFEGVLSNNIDEILSADKIIFPGVGEASSAMKKLQERVVLKLE